MNNDTKHYLKAVAKDQETVVAWERNLWLSVDIARSHGATWEEIGETLGVSRQAAQQRFSKPPPQR